MARNRIRNFFAVLAIPVALAIGGGSIAGATNHGATSCSLQARVNENGSATFLYSPPDQRVRYSWFDGVPHAMPVGMQFTVDPTSDLFQYVTQDDWYSIEATALKCPIPGGTTTTTAQPTTTTAAPTTTTAQVTTTTAQPTTTTAAPTTTSTAPDPTTTTAPAPTTTASTAPVPPTSAPVSTTAAQSAVPYSGPVQGVAGNAGTMQAPSLDRLAHTGPTGTDRIVGAGIVLMATGGGVILTRNKIRKANHVR